MMARQMWIIVCLNFSFSFLFLSSTMPQAPSTLGGLSYPFTLSQKLFSHGLPLPSSLLVTSAFISWISLKTDFSFQWVDTFCNLFDQFLQMTSANVGSEFPWHTIRTFWVCIMHTCFFLSIISFFRHCHVLRCRHTHYLISYIMFIISY